jgi:hypothetical protein
MTFFDSKYSDSFRCIKDAEQTCLELLETAIGYCSFADLTSGNLVRFVDEGISVELTDVEDDSVYFLSRDMFLLGLVTVAIRKLLDNYDVDDADEVLQEALFGEVLFA